MIVVDREADGERLMKLDRCGELNERDNIIGWWTQSGEWYLRRCEVPLMPIRINPMEPVSTLMVAELGAQVPSPVDDELCREWNRQFTDFSTRFALAILLIEVYLEERREFATWTPH